jgi:phage tail sheath protein FI
MPQALSYPGVYVEELPSGVRTITGVATAIAAFVGYTRQGPPDLAVPVYSFADFERSHGGLDRDSPLSYAVRQFFTNGGTQACVVRVAVGTATAQWVLNDDGAAPVLTATASNPGSWANDHVLTVTTADALNPNAQFNLVVSQNVGTTTTVLEIFRNLTLNPNSPQFAPSVVNASSKRIQLALAGAPVYSNAGFAVSPVVNFPLAATPDLAIAGTIDGNTTFRLQLPAGPLPADIDALVTALTAQVPPALAGRLAISKSDTDGSAGTTCLKIASTLVGPKSTLAMAAGGFGGLARNIGIGLANGGREFTGDAQHRPAATANAVPGTMGDDGSKGGALELIGGVVGTTKTGMQALLDVDLFNILSIPETFDLAEAAGTPVIQAGISLCEGRRAFYVVDPPSGKALGDLAAWAVTVPSRNAAAYFPSVLIADPLDALRARPMAASGSVAGLYARTDSNRGVWKAPAGTDATLAGIAGLGAVMNDIENGTINQKGVNALRTFPAYGSVVWGARTLRGSDALADEYKYIPVRRLALFLEESLYRGTQWVVFEPNDEPLWAQIRLNLGAFMQNLFRQGAFQGKSPKEAYFVRCDSTTTTQTDINNGVVNIIVGFAPLKPAEFVVLQLQQIAGDIPT